MDKSYNDTLYITNILIWHRGDTERQSFAVTLLTIMLLKNLVSSVI